MTHLRRYLEDSGAIAPEHLDAALRRQQIYGGSLDTILLELGTVDPITLGELLVLACGLPLCPGPLIEASAERPWKSVPAELLEVGWVVPLTDAPLQVGVHPDLPNERLGALYRAAPGTAPMVMPECCLEKIAAERRGSVVPQRYAVLAAAYLSASRRHSSVADVGFPILPEHATGRRVDSPAATPNERATIVATHAPRDAAESAPADGPPPVRFSARGTPLRSHERGLSTAAEQGIRAKVEDARAALAAARSRAEVLDALSEGVTAISNRLALFRIRVDSLLGLASHGSSIDAIEGQVVALAPYATLRAAIDDGHWAGEITDAELRDALSLPSPYPCLIERIDVGGRPVLMLYVDNGGRELLPVEAGWVHELGAAASQALEELVLQRHADASTKPVQPEQHKRGWGPPPSELTHSFSGSDKSHVRAAVPSILDGARRPTHLDGSPPPRDRDDEEEQRPRFLTVPAMPPPPPLPPPPPMMGVAEDVDPRSDASGTLTGVPAATQTTSPRPRFVPPPLEDQDDSGIVPLASPIDQPSIRGRIQLEDEDWTRPAPADPGDPHLRRRIDALLAALGAGETELEAIASLGEPAFARLARELPGPLEIMRRDLRSLPPPSAHGPLMRAIIRIGAPIVPHVLDAMHEVDAEGRFYIAFVFQELRDSRCMESLAHLAFDPNGDVRVIAMRVLETYSRTEEFAAAVSIVRSELDSLNTNKQLYAARAVGTLRDVDAIAELVELLARKDRFIQEAALESLCSVTGQQHGLKPHRWKNWYLENRHRHRVEWIIDSLHHRDLPVRRWANDELIRITGHRVPFSPLGDKDSREVAAAAWLGWWTATGRSRFGLQAQNAG